VRRDAAYKKVTSGGLRKTGAMSLGDKVKCSVLETWWISEDYVLPKLQVDFKQRLKYLSLTQKLPNILNCVESKGLKKFPPQQSAPQMFLIFKQRYSPGYKGVKHLPNIDFYPH
jgi:hypothetical protein